MDEAKFDCWLGDFEYKKLEIDDVQVDRGAGGGLLGEGAGPGVPGEGGVASGGQAGCDGQHYLLSSHSSITNTIW